MLCIRLHLHCEFLLLGPDVIYNTIMVLQQGLVMIADLGNGDSAEDIEIKSAHLNEKPRSDPGNVEYFMALNIISVIGVVIILPCSSVVLGVARAGLCSCNADLPASLPLPFPPLINSVLHSHWL